MKKKMVLFNNKKLTRRAHTVVSFILCVALAGTLVCVPTLALNDNTRSSSTASLHSGELTAFSPAKNTGVDIVSDGSDRFVLIRDLTDVTVGCFKTCFMNNESQIKVFRDGVLLADSDLIGTDCTVKCVSSGDNTNVYETAKAVVFCDVDGDGGFDEDDIDAIFDKAVMGIDGLITDGSAFAKAADSNEDGAIDAFDISVADRVNASRKFYINFEKADVNEFTTKFEHTDEFLYRIGNGNTVKLGSLFEVSKAGGSAVVSANVNIGAYAFDSDTSVKGAGTNLVSDSTAKCVYTKNSSDWTQSTLKFTGEGPVEIVISEGEGREYCLLVEVVNANNATSATSATSANMVLLNDVSTTGRLSVSKTVYGNGFSITDNRAKASTTTRSGFITLQNGAALDNVVILGQLYSSAVMSYYNTSGVLNEEFSPCLSVSGDVGIYNSYISGCRSTMEITSGNVYIENTILDGGRVSNAEITGGNVTFNNCVTTSSTRDSNASLGIMVSGSSAKINLQGTFKQYNWITQAQVNAAVPSPYNSLFSSIYSGSTFPYTYNGNKYVNMGIFFFAESTQFTVEMAQSIINDETTNNYTYEAKSTSGYKAVLYSALGSSGTPEMLTTPPYESEGQYFTLPVYNFDFTNKNYMEKVSGDNNYCYYDSATGIVNISFDKEDDSTVFNWDTDILTVNKYGHSLDSTVTMGGIDYTGRSIAFAESGNYEVNYTYVDTQNYDADFNISSHTYVKTVRFTVTAVQPDITIYHPEFTYPNIGDHSSKSVIANNKTYIMPNVTATSSDIGSSTVGGKTIYYPIITLSARSASNGNYSSGDIWYFAPAFRDINIVDKNKDTGATLYTYDTSATKWPHNISASTRPSTSGDYYGYVSTHPWESGSGDSGRSAGTVSGLGLCYKSGGFNKTRNGGTQLVEFYYKANDGITYYYYIKYVYQAQTYSSCVTDGTLVTMADGTKKPIEQVKQGDMVMTWSLWNGCYEAQPVVLKWYHGTQNWNVLTLHFSDGTEVRTINQHGFFDADENTYVYITPDNVGDYIGHRFIKQNDDGNNETVILSEYTLAEETVGSYSLQTAYNENFMVEGMLSMTGEDYKGRFEYFEVGDGMKYDEEKMLADIENYGLYSYEEFSEYLSPVEFDLFNGKYFKVLVGKGVFTKEEILGIIKDNL